MRQEGETLDCCAQEHFFNPRIVGTSGVLDGSWKPDPYLIYQTWKFGFQPWVETQHDSGPGSVSKPQIPLD